MTVRTKGADGNAKTSFAKNVILKGVTVCDMNNLGCGVAKCGGKTVFVRGGVTDDVCDIKIIKDTADYAVAAVDRMISASPRRIDPVCPVYKRCGGCVYRLISYDYELSLKRSAVERAFCREGLSPVIKDIMSGRESGYRNKVQYPVAYDRTVGYFAQKTHEVVPVEHCLLQDPAFDRVMDVIKEFLDKYGICGYDEESGRGTVRHICLRSGEGGISVCLVINDDKLPHAESLVKMLSEKCPDVGSLSVSINKKKTNVIFGERTFTIYGKPYITDRLCSLEFGISPASFYQVNRDMAEMLYKKAAEYAALSDGMTLVDLFCGVGTIGLSMIKDKPHCRLVGVEIIPEAVANAAGNAAANGIENASLICGDANSAEVGSADVIVIDPPRKGCSPGLIDTIASGDCKRVVYISCNPSTLARDCGYFEKHGFETVEVTPADLFPRTGHVECAALLCRRDGEAQPTHY